jgi:hypothetical protein
MALDAVSFMRTGARGSPSWSGHSPETGYVDADCSDGIAENTCRRGGPYVFDLDGLRILAFSGEILDEWRPILWRAIVGQCLATSYAAGDATYVPPDAVRQQGGYEAEGFMAAFDLAGCFVEDLDDLVADAVRGLVAP